MYQPLGCDSFGVVVHLGKNLEVQTATTPEIKKSEPNSGFPVTTDRRRNSSVKDGTEDYVEVDFLSDAPLTEEEIKAADEFFEVFDEEFPDFDDYLDSLTNEERALVEDWLLSEEQSEVLYISAGTAEEALGIFVQRYFSDHVVIVRNNGNDNTLVSGDPGSEMKDPPALPDTNATDKILPQDTDGSSNDIECVVASKSTVSDKAQLTVSVTTGDDTVSRVDVLSTDQSESEYESESKINDEFPAIIDPCKDRIDLLVQDYDDSLRLIFYELETESKIVVQALAHTAIPGRTSVTVPTSSKYFPYGNTSFPSVGEGLNVHEVQKLGGMADSAPETFAPHTSNLKVPVALHETSPLAVPVVPLLEDYNTHNNCTRTNDTNDNNSNSSAVLQLYEPSLGQSVGPVVEEPTMDAVPCSRVDNSVLGVTVHTPGAVSIKTLSVDCCQSLLLDVAVAREKDVFSPSQASVHVHGKSVQDSFFEPPAKAIVTVSPQVSDHDSTGRKESFEVAIPRGAVLVLVPEELLSPAPVYAATVVTAGDLSMPGTASADFATQCGAVSHGSRDTVSALRGPTLQTQEALTFVTTPLENTDNSENALPGSFAALRLPPREPHANDAVFAGGVLSPHMIYDTTLVRNIDSGPAVAGHEICVWPLSASVCVEMVGGVFPSTVRISCF